MKSAITWRKADKPAQILAYAKERLTAIMQSKPNSEAERLHSIDKILDYYNKRRMMKLNDFLNLMEELPPLTLL